MMSNWTLASQGEPHVLPDTEDFPGADRFEIICCYFY